VRSSATAKARKGMLVWQAINKVLSTRYRVIPGQRSKLTWPKARCFQKSMGICRIYSFYTQHAVLFVRHYSIIDRYVFPDENKLKTAQQLSQEEAERKKKEEEKKRRLEIKKKKERNLMKNWPIQKKPVFDENIFQSFLPPKEQPAIPKSLNVCILGPPNAGKSTLLNRIVGTRVSAVSPKAQTTRERILGIATINQTQLVFFDTPGIISPAKQRKFNRDIVLCAWETIDDADLIMLVVDIVKTIDEDLKSIISELEKLQQELIEDRESNKEMILVLNKLDLAKKDRDEENALKRFEFHFPNIQSLFSQIFLISALTGENFDKLQTYLLARAIERPWMYSKEVKTDQSDLKRAAEIIREKIFRRTNQEVPYNTKQENIGWTICPNGDLRIDQNIIVTKESHKRILVGHKAKTIAAICHEARKDLSVLFKRKVHLFLTVQCKDEKFINSRDDLL